MSGISWEGKRVNKKYRNNGQGVEEVLTTEVLMGLSFLPPRPFLEDFIKQLSSAPSAGPFIASEEIDSLRFLPKPTGRHALKPDALTHQAAIDVQIDAMAETSHSRIFIEAKRIGSSYFQEEQLARTFLIALRESDDLSPKVLLLLGSPPPVKVKKLGRVEVKDGILARLEEVYKKTDYLDFSLSEAESRIDDCVAWTTWQQIANCVHESMKNYENQDSSTYVSIERIANFVQGTVEWHS
jgi:hypothetical protein